MCSPCWVVVGWEPNEKKASYLTTIHPNGLIVGVLSFLPQMIPQLRP